MNDIARRAIVLGGLAMTTTPTQAAGPKRAWDFSFPAIEGGTIELADMRGRVLMVVNTASFCGFTPQYEGLQALHEAHRGDGLTVIGVPSRDFNQESATNAEVQRFCETRFGIDFPMTGILGVRGDAAHPFYRWVREERNWEPGWNFNKVLIGRDGRVAAVFGASDAPAGKRVSGAVAEALAAGM